ncbi:Gfo/Idh/MocA family oxidoreductase [Pseudoduganella lutea]|uniref:Gfo/Idh/MocA family oxidoreductase n=1 Tax=Pseudoduganella lutea TaxID=321985 RepID=A0A4P6L486_9BURK|nr:Gfo/Idh/MocA family oxidoreductase [Pseudoduganella lutea]QBE66401.1 Gfo/Idh/MocA family oxidoreductase [Pseudoduganella lutea]
MAHTLSSPRRRQLVKGALATLTAPYLGHAMAASGKVNLACVGIGNRAADVIKALHATGLANIVALCDVDMGAPHTLEIMKLFPDVPRFQDFRRMFDSMGKQIDAVSIGTPDFSHFPIAMLAMSQGKHVYCEKPMGQSFREIALMMAAERKYKVAAQMGNQGHSEANYFQFKSWVDAGIIKNVRAITAHMNNPRRWHGMKVNGYLPRQPVPATLDWDGWVATGAWHDYNRGYINGDWRSWYDYGNGALGDWGAHIFDTAHEFLQLGLPTEVEAVRLEGWSPFIFPQASTLAFRFPERGALPPLELTWYDGVDNLPPLPKDYGAAIVDPNIPPPSKGSADAPKLPPGKIIYGEGLTFKGGSHGSQLSIVGTAGRDIALPSVPTSPSKHFANFLKACMGEETCRSSFAVAGPLCQAMALGVIAQRVNGKLSFDPVSKRITNHPKANALLAGAPPRKGWEQYYKLA